MYHRPVLLQEVLGLLDLKPGAVVVDGTLGSGGHAKAILEKIGPAGRLIGLDQDPEALARCEKLFAGETRVTLQRKNFRFIREVLESLNMPPVEAVLFDIGMSSDQLANGKRGFSFREEGDLDMRMDPEVGEKASYYLAQWPEAELARVFYEYAGEKFSRRFARAIVEERRKAPIETPQHLAQVIESTHPASRNFQKGKRPRWASRHPATKVFQALRILVNDELGALSDGIDGAWKSLAAGGKLAVISFHSLEDRIVKQKFRSFASRGEGTLLTRKPTVAKRSEIFDNPRARSAKLRAIEKKP